MRSPQAWIGWCAGSNSCHTRSRMPAAMDAIANTRIPIVDKGLVADKERLRTRAPCIALNVSRFNRGVCDGRFCAVSWCEERQSLEAESRQERKPGVEVVRLRSRWALTPLRMT